MEEKERVCRLIRERRERLGEEVDTGELSLMTLPELDSQVQALDDEVTRRQSKIQHACQAIERLWEVMSVTARFPLDPADLSRENLMRLETEKGRLFELQKARFREMLEAQETELESLWQQLHYPKELSEATRAEMQSRTSESHGHAM